MPYPFEIETQSRELARAIQSILDNKTKPPGSLGQLEHLARRIAGLQKSLTPTLGRLAHLVFAAEHGVCDQGISPYPREVTRQMVLNFMSGGAAINVFCRQHDVDLTVVDAGLTGDPLPEHPALVNARVSSGSRDFTTGPAMTTEEIDRALLAGAEIAKSKIQGGFSILSFGEMGIGNSTVSAALMAACLGLPPQDCVGVGTGADEEMIARKVSVIEKALALHGLRLDDGKAIMEHLGGLELAMMAGAMGATAEEGCPFLVDGFIASAALLTLWKDHPEILDYAIFSHESDEAGHKALLRHLGVRPLLNLDLRLGEGTGAILAWPLLQSAVAFFNEMASFESAQVSNAPKNLAVN